MDTDASIDYFGRFRKRSKYHTPPPTPDTTEASKRKESSVLSYYSLHPSERNSPDAKVLVPYSAETYPQQATRIYKDPSNLLNNLLWVEMQCANDWHADFG